MKDKKTKSLYEINFTERDVEVLRLEDSRSEIENELAGALAEFAKISGRKKLFRRNKKDITPLLLEGKDQMK